MIQLFSRVSGVEEAWIHAQRAHPTAVNFQLDRLNVRLTQWPDLGSPDQGWLALDGTLQPFFEHMLVNDGGY
jgi:hypothetical protein